MSAWSNLHWIRKIDLSYFTNKLCLFIAVSNAFSA
ncbi:hypothetical protein WP4W18C03_16800 [Pseudomonas putida]|nr:hypothetical protein WP4W18C03_16800 [Pseudomonas putida]